MDRETAIRIMSRRLNHLNQRIESARGSEQALMFDMREKEALEFLIDDVTPPLMAKEVDEATSRNV